MSSILLLFYSVAGCAFGVRTQLPYLVAPTSPPTLGRAPNAAVQSLERQGKWWVRVNDHVYYQPPSHSELSSDVSDYYYAVGDESALPEEMKAHRVGGEGRHHLFHFMKGAPVPKTPITADRRSSISLLQQVSSGEELSSIFPVYSLSSTYSNPCDGQKADHELRTVGNITENMMETLLREVTSLPSRDMPTRSSDNPDATRAIQEYLVKEFRASDYSVCRHTFHGRDDYGKSGRHTNIVAVVPGTSADSITVGAHYDSRPYSGRAPGADDNGSGVATLLAIARAFRGMRPRKTIYFVGFAAEEKGLVGSTRWVQHLRSGNPLPDCPASSPPSGFLRDPQHSAIILDEVGWKSPKLPKTTINLESYDWPQEVLENLAQSSKDHNEGKLQIVHSNNPFGSDHMPFLESRMPAVLVINGDDESYPDYHASTDRFENVNIPMLFKVAKLCTGALMRLARAC